jgi:hypothetical protein
MQSAVKEWGSVFKNGDVVTERGMKRIVRGKMCPVDRGTEGYANIF